MGYGERTGLLTPQVRRDGLSQRTGAVESSFLIITSEAARYGARERRESNSAVSLPLVSSKGMKADVLLS